VLGGVDFRGSLSLSFCFSFELFFVVFLDLSLFVQFVGFAVFPSSR
jgi:hypothetical protein